LFEVLLKEKELQAFSSRMRARFAGRQIREPLDPFPVPAYNA
jgi:hypothetical protein